jgi:transmembrane sensor
MIFRRLTLPARPTGQPAGKVRHVALADGSTLRMTTTGEAAVRLTKQRRDVRLLRGEGLVEVARDASRPFVVQANDAGVRVVGTAIAARLRNERVDVALHRLGAPRFGA